MTSSAQEERTPVEHYPVDGVSNVRVKHVASKGGWPVLHEYFEFRPPKGQASFLTNQLFGAKLWPKEEMRLVREQTKGFRLVGVSDRLDETAASVGRLSRMEKSILAERKNGVDELELSQPESPNELARERSGGPDVS